MLASQTDASGLPYVLSSALSLPKSISGAKSSQDLVGASPQDKENSVSQENVSTTTSDPHASPSIHSIQVFSTGEHEHVCVLRGREAILSSRPCGSAATPSTSLSVIGSVQLPENAGMPVVARWTPNGTHVLIGDTLGKLHLITQQGKLLFSHSFATPTAAHSGADTGDCGVTALAILPCTRSNMTFLVGSANGSLVRVSGIDLDNLASTRSRLSVLDFSNTRACHADGISDICILPSQTTQTETNETNVLTTVAIVGKGTHALSVWKLHTNEDTELAREKRMSVGVCSTSKSAEVQRTGMDVDGGVRVDYALDGAVLVLLDSAGLVTVWDTCTLLLLSRWDGFRVGDMCAMTPGVRRGGNKIALLLLRSNDNPPVDGSNECDDRTKAPASVFALCDVTALQAPTPVVLLEKNNNSNATRSLVLSRMHGEGRGSLYIANANSNNNNSASAFGEGDMDMLLLCKPSTADVVLQDMIRAKQFAKAEEWAIQHNLDTAIVLKAHLESLMQSAFFSSSQAQQSGGRQSQSDPKADRFSSTDDQTSQQVTTSATLLHDIRAVLDKLANIDTDYVVMGCIGITLPWASHQTDLLQYAFAIAHDASREASSKVRVAVADTMQRWNTYCALVEAAASNNNNNNNNNSNGESFPGEEEESESNQQLPSWPDMRRASIQTLVRSALSRGQISDAKLIWRRHVLDPEALITENMDNNGNIPSRNINTTFFTSAVTLLDSIPLHVPASHYVPWIAQDILAHMNDATQRQALAQWANERARLAVMEGLGVQDALVVTGLFFEDGQVGGSGSGSGIASAFDTALDVVRMVDVMHDCELFRYNYASGSGSRTAAGDVASKDDDLHSVTGRLRVTHLRLCEMAYLGSMHGLWLDAAALERDLETPQVMRLLLHRVDAPELIAMAITQHVRPCARRYHVPEDRVLVEYVERVAKDINGPRSALVQRSLAIIECMGSWEPKVRAVLALVRSALPPYQSDLVSLVEEAARHGDASIAAELREQRRLMGLRTIALRYNMKHINFADSKDGRYLLGHILARVGGSGNIGSIDGSNNGDEGEEHDSSMPGVGGGISSTSGNVVGKQEQCLSDALFVSAAYAIANRRDVFVSFLQNLPMYVPPRGSSRSSSTSDTFTSTSVALSPMHDDHGRRHEQMDTEYEKTKKNNNKWDVNQQTRWTLKQIAADDVDVASVAQEALLFHMDTLDCIAEMSAAILTQNHRDHFERTADSALVLCDHLAELITQNTTTPSRSTGSEENDKDEWCGAEDDPNGYMSADVGAVGESPILLVMDLASVRHQLRAQRNFFAFDGQVVSGADLSNPSFKQMRVQQELVKLVSLSNKNNKNNNSVNSMLGTPQPTQYASSHYGAQVEVSPNKKRKKNGQEWEIMEEEGDGESAGDKRGKVISAYHEVYLPRVGHCQMDLTTVRTLFPFCQALRVEPPQVSREVITACAAKGLSAPVMWLCNDLEQDAENDPNVDTMHATGVYLRDAAVALLMSLDHVCAKQNNQKQEQARRLKLPLIVQSAAQLLSASARRCASGELSDVLLLLRNAMLLVESVDYCEVGSYSSLWGANNGPIDLVSTPLTMMPRNPSWYLEQANVLESTRQIPGIVKLLFAVTRARFVASAGQSDLLSPAVASSARTRSQSKDTPKLRFAPTPSLSMTSATAADGSPPTQTPVTTPSNTRGSLLSLARGHWYDLVVGLSANGADLLALSCLDAVDVHLMDTALEHARAKAHSTLASRVLLASSTGSIGVDTDLSLGYLLSLPATARAKATGMLTRATHTLHESACSTSSGGPAAGNQNSNTNNPNNSVFVRLVAVARAGRSFAAMTKQRHIAHEFQQTEARAYWWNFLRKVGLKPEQHLHTAMSAAAALSSNIGGSQARGGGIPSDNRSVDLGADVSMDTGAASSGHQEEYVQGWGAEEQEHISMEVEAVLPELLRRVGLDLNMARSFAAAFGVSPHVGVAYFVVESLRVLDSAAAFNAQASYAVSDACKHTMRKLLPHLFSSISGNEYARLGLVCSITIAFFPECENELERKMEALEVLEEMTHLRGSRSGTNTSASGGSVSIASDALLGDLQANKEQHQQQDGGGIRGGAIDFHGLWADPWKVLQHDLGNDTIAPIVGLSHTLGVDPEHLYVKLVKASVMGEDEQEDVEQRGQLKPGTHEIESNAHGVRSSKAIPPFASRLKPMLISIRHVQLRYDAALWVTRQQQERKQEGNSDGIDDRVDALVFTAGLAKELFGEGDDRYIELQTLFRREATTRDLQRALGTIEATELVQLLDDPHELVCQLYHRFAAEQALRLACFNGIASSTSASSDSWTTNNTEGKNMKKEDARTQECFAGSGVNGLHALVDSLCESLGLRGAVIRRFMVDRWLRSPVTSSVADLKPGAGLVSNTAQSVFTSLPAENWAAQDERAVRSITYVLHHTSDLDAENVDVAKQKAAVLLIRFVLARTASLSSASSCAVDGSANGNPEVQTTYRARARALRVAVTIAPASVVLAEYTRALPDSSTTPTLASFWQHCLYMVDIEEMRLPQTMTQLLHCDKHGMARGLWRDHRDSSDSPRALTLILSLVLDFEIDDPELVQAVCVQMAQRGQHRLLLGALRRLSGVKQQRGSSGTLTTELEPLWEACLLQPLRELGMNGAYLTPPPHPTQPPSFSSSQLPARLSVMQQVVVLLERCPFRQSQRMANVRMATLRMLRWLGSPFERLEQRVAELGST